MSKRTKDEDAAVLIDAFAAQLLTLNDGKAIPVSWQKRITEAVRNPPAPMSEAKAKKHVRDVLIVKLLAQKDKKIRAPRTKHHNPTVAKDEIAAEVGVSRKTVENIHNKTPEQLGAVLFDGMLAALGEAMDAESSDSLAAILKAEQLARKAKHDQLVGSIPKKRPGKK